MNSFETMASEALQRALDLHQNLRTIPLISPECYRPVGPVEVTDAVSVRVDSAGSSLYTHGGGLGPQYYETPWIEKGTEPQHVAGAVLMLLEKVYQDTVAVRASNSKTLWFTRPAHETGSIGCFRVALYSWYQLRVGDVLATLHLGITDFRLVLRVGRLRLQPDEIVLPWAKPELEAAA